MAKKSTIPAGLIRRTDVSTSLEETSSETLPTRRRDGEDKVIAVSVAMRQSEFDALQAIADQHHASRGSLLTVLMRYAMQDLQDGKINLKVQGLKFIS